MLTTVTSFFKTGLSIKYISPWQLKDPKYSTAGNMFFYNGDCNYLVQVSFYDSPERVTIKDIEVLYGEYTHADDILQKISECTDDIVNAAKNMPQDEDSFVYDVEKKQVVTHKHFNTLLPMRGLMTPFIFSNYEESPIVYIMINAMKSIEAGSLYVWLLTYIHSKNICLAPMYESNEFSIGLFQALVQYFVYHGKSRPPVIDISKTMVGFPLTDCGEFAFEIPGKTARISVLLDKALIENKKAKEKGKKKNGRHRL